VNVNVSVDVDVDAVLAPASSDSWWGRAYGVLCQPINMDLEALISL
jgi:hypothetical protein